MKKIQKCKRKKMLELNLRCLNLEMFPLHSQNCLIIYYQAPTWCREIIVTRVLSKSRDWKDPPHTDKVAHITAIAGATSGPVKEGFSIWRKVGMKRIWQIIVLTHIQGGVAQHKVPRDRVNCIDHLHLCEAGRNHTCHNHTNKESNYLLHPQHHHCDNCSSRFQFSWWYN